MVVGGYDPSLAPEAWTHPALGVDFIVRGEGEMTFRELLRALERATAARRRSPACGFATADGFQPQPAARRDARSSDGDDPAAEPRRARAVRLHACSGRPVDVVETSRGCTFDCSFCSIIEMRGRNFHRFPIERVIADIADARARGARAIFLVDDNITLDVRAVRGAVPRHHRRRAERHRLHRAGDDRADRQPRRRRWRR